MRRRGFLRGLIAAPAVVKAVSLMPVKQVPIPPPRFMTLADYERDILRPNTLLIINQITREAFKLFANTNRILQGIDSQYANEFLRTGERVGHTLRVRLPNDFVPLRLPS